MQIYPTWKKRVSVKKIERDVISRRGDTLEEQSPNKGKLNKGSVLRQQNTWPCLEMGKDDGAAAGAGARGQQHGPPSFSDHSLRMMMAASKKSHFGARQTSSKTCQDHICHQPHLNNTEKSQRAFLPFCHSLFFILSVNFYLQLMLIASVVPSDVLSS